MIQLGRWEIIKQKQIQYLLSQISLLVFMIGKRFCVVTSHSPPRSAWNVTLYNVRSATVSVWTPHPPHHHQHHHQSGGAGGGGEGGVLLGLCTCFLLPKSVLCQWVKFISKEQKESFSSVPCVSTSLQSIIIMITNSFTFPFLMLKVNYVYVPSNKLVKCVTTKSMNLNHYAVDEFLIFAVHI